MSWINTLRTSAEDLGTLAENGSSTDFVAFAFDHVKHSTVHRQGKEEEVKRSMAKKPPKDIGQLEPSDTAAKRQLRGYAVETWKILDEKLIQKIDWRRAKIYSRGGKELRQPPKRELEILCSIPSSQKILQISWLRT